MTAPKTVQQLRAEFAKLQRNAGITATKEEWLAEVRKVANELFGTEPTPEQWVEAATKATVKCDNCRNGIYQWGACVNGRMTHSGVCFRCQGKGRQNQADFRRIFGYLNHMKVV